MRLVRWRTDGVVHHAQLRRDGEEMRRVDGEAVGATTRVSLRSVVDIVIHLLQ
jgi:hypothetical protein